LLDKPPRKTGTTRTTQRKQPITKTPIIPQPIIPQPIIPQPIRQQVTIPRATIPQVTIPQVTIPQVTIPQVTIPRAIIPQPTIPRATIPQAIIPQPIRQQVLIPQPTITQTTRQIKQKPGPKMKQGGGNRGKRGVEDIFAFENYPQDFGLFSQYFTGIELYLRLANWIQYKYEYLREYEMEKLDNEVYRVTNIKKFLEDITGTFEPREILERWFKHFKPILNTTEKIDETLERYYLCEDVLFNKLYRTHVDNNWVYVPLWFADCPRKTKTGESPIKRQIPIPNVERPTIPQQPRVPTVQTIPRVPPTGITQPISPTIPRVPGVPLMGITQPISPNIARPTTPNQLIVPAIPKVLTTIPQIQTNRDRQRFAELADEPDMTNRLVRFINLSFPETTTWNQEGLRNKAVQALNFMLK
jgi:hypothetical protein